MIAFLTLIVRAKDIRKMDLTTRRGEDSGAEDTPVDVDSTGQCLVNGGQGCEVTAMAPDVTPPTRKTTSFSIRNLVGAEDTDRSADGNTNSNEGEFFFLIYSLILNLLFILNNTDMFPLSAYRQLISFCINSIFLVMQTA